MGRGQTHSLDDARKTEGDAVLQRVGSQGEMRVVEVAVTGDWWPHRFEGASRSQSASRCRADDPAR